MASIVLVHGINHQRETRFYMKSPDKSTGPRPAAGHDPGLSNVDMAPGSASHTESEMAASLRRLASVPR